MIEQRRVTMKKVLILNGSFCEVPIIKKAKKPILVAVSPVTYLSDATSGYWSTFTAWLDLPIIPKLMEYNEIWVKILAKMPGMPSAVCKSPVISPHSMPAINEITNAITGCTPARISTTATAPQQ